MSREQEQFKDVRRLLALKRHETPPPGYFNRFSGDVMARIKAGERAPDRVGILDRITSALGLQAAWSALETRPVVAGATGLAMCAFLAFGVFALASGPDATGQIADMGANPEMFKLQEIASTGTPSLIPPSMSTGGATAEPGGDSLFQQAAAARQPMFLRVSAEGQPLGNQ